MIKFHKIGYDQFKKDIVNSFIHSTRIEYNYSPITSDKEELIKELYNSIKLPKRATVGSAGYDFFAPFDIVLEAGDTIYFPSGIAAEMDDNVALFLYPRSGLGFKYRLQLDNTVGVIDCDYYGSEQNGGHIGVKLTNDTRDGKTVRIKKGEAYMQGVFTPFVKTDDDDADGERRGGFGSTTGSNPQNWG